MNLHFAAPQIIYLGLICLGLGIHIAKHGERNDYDAAAAIFGQAIMMGLLYWGGFFTN